MARRNAKRKSIQEFLAKFDCSDSADMDDVDKAIMCVDQALSYMSRPRRLHDR